MIKPYAEQAQSDVRMDVSMTVNGSLRTIPFTEFHRLLGNTPERDNVLDRGDLVEGGVA